MNPTSIAALVTLSAISSEFGYLVDHGRATECAELFTSDAKLVFGPGTPKPGTLEGLEAIRGFLTARQALTHVTTRHIATNFRLEYDDGATARLESLLTVFRSDNSSRHPIVSTVSDIREIFTRAENDTWKIQERGTSPIFIHMAP